MTFLTVEDINEVIFNNQEFYWHEIDTSKISTTNDFVDVQYDFCKVSREVNGNYYDYTFKIDSANWSLGYYVIGGNLAYLERTNTKIKVRTSNSYCKLFLYMGNLKLDKPTVMYFFLVNHELQLTLKQVNEPQVIYYCNNINPSYIFSYSANLNIGYNSLNDPQINQFMGWLLVKIIKTNFQFECNQNVILGKVNKVKLGANDDYKPNGALVGEYTPNIQVLYNNTYIPVTFDSTLNDYVFNLDLINKQIEGKVKLKVFVDVNDVLNASETDIVLNCSFETINNESKLKTLFENGGFGRLGANITLTSDITVDNDVLIIGNAKTINMNNHKIIVPADKTFKAENTVFDNGQNTIQQQINSIVELNDCSFNNCTGFGSVIDCQINTSSLSVEDDFITNITGCTFNNNDMCILHGGDLNVTGCTVNGKIGNANNPYFLYQTDGEAVILQSAFKLQSNTQIESDIEFNSCIFVCGETAIVNGYSHEELQQNNISSFITSPQNNTSKINVTYYYPAVEDYITLESSNGYCHACSGIDFVFKNNVTARRE